MRNLGFVFLYILCFLTNISAKQSEIKQINSGFDYGTINYVKSLGNYYLVNYTKNGIATIALYKDNDEFILSIKDGDFKGKLSAPYRFYDLNISWDQKYITLNTWCEPSGNGGPNGGPLEQFCDLLKIDIENKKVIRVISKGDTVTTGIRQFNQLIDTGNIYQISGLFPGKNGDIFTASIINPKENKIQMRGIFKIKDGKVTQLMSNLFVGADGIHPDDAPKEDKAGNIFFLGFAPGFLTNIRVIDENGKNEKVVFNNQDQRPMERLSVPISLFTDVINGTIYARNLFSNTSLYVYPQLTLSVIYSNRFFNMFSGSLDINGDGFFTKKPRADVYEQNTSISNIVRSPATYAEVVNSADNLSGTPIGAIGDYIGAQKCAVMGISKDKKDRLFRASFMKIDNVTINGREATILGCFAGLTKSNAKVYVNGVSVNPENIVNVNEKSVTIKLQVNVSGKTTFSLSSGDLNTINDFVFDIPVTPANFKLTNVVKDIIGVDEQVHISWCADVPGKIEVMIDPDNPVTIGVDINNTCGESNYSINKSSTFKVKFIGINGSIEQIEFFVTVKAPEIKDVRSDDDKSEIFKGGVAVIYGENISNKISIATEKTTILEGIELLVGGVKAEILSINQNQVIFRVPEELTGEVDIYLIRYGEASNGYKIKVAEKGNKEQ